jgi:hypothetical protein
VGEDLSLTMYFFTVGPTQIYTSQPFSLHCNKKLIHAAGDHHGSRQNIRPYRTLSFNLTLPRSAHDSHLGYATPAQLI